MSTALLQSLDDDAPDSAGRKNLLQLIQLRWLAVAGQLATILLTHFAFGILLPLAPMLGVLIGLVLLNLVSLPLGRLDRRDQGLERSPGGDRRRHCDTSLARGQTQVEQRLCLPARRRLNVRLVYRSVSID